MTKNKIVADLSRVGISVIAALSLGACASMDRYGVGLQSLEASIEFDDDGCPTDVKPSADAECTGVGHSGKICAERNQMVVWQSVDALGTDVAQDYEIYFDPFKQGPTIGSNANGRAQAVIDGDAPEVEYKYTIVGLNCEDDPLDPRIIVY